MTNLQPRWIVSIYLLCSSTYYKYELGDNFCNFHNGAAAGLRWRSWSRQVDPEEPIWSWPPSSFAMDFGPPAKKTNFSINFPNFCDYFVKKVVFEIRKCHQPQRDIVPLTPCPSVIF